MLLLLLLLLLLTAVVVQYYHRVNYVAFVFLSLFLSHYSLHVDVLDSSIGHNVLDSALW